MSPPPPNRLLDVRDLTVRHGEHTAVDGVSFHVDEGETLALIGASGCGKSSTAAAVLALLRPEQGSSVRFAGQELTTLRGRRLRALRPQFQPVFQDPYGSLAPRTPIGDTVVEPLRVHRRPVAGRAAELLDLVGLDPAYARRLPHELSGGQCQRVGIARALALGPRLLVLDEPLSALDPSVRSGIVNLLTDLQERLGLGYLFICHDLALVGHLAHRVAVMKAGRIVESAPVREVFTAPRHPYTRDLLSAARHRSAVRPHPLV
ncbi:ATP-binding cassette domain-containing protein [Streptomyces sp. NBC_00237]|uniref:ATP-binding cassette domain-containing protein n=1 Tax=Streptomyces sp. NBC_00237 TaxID=2975687 RepID=UPI0022502B33|nr:ABC transporter ATP-binding protein [Streptomyces sp. NBC_00237]MCX5206311.1 ATP-binding cassette domain-containing protein [Streptomyces sp. NBC_00237]